MAALFERFSPDDIVVEWLTNATDLLHVAPTHWMTGIERKENGSETPASDAEPAKFRQKRVSECSDHA
jgi:hypothetical protein